MARVVPENLFSSVLNNRSITSSRYSALKNGDYYLHVSDIMKVNKAHEFCPRQYVLSYHEDPHKHIRQLTAGQELLFAFGHALHDNVRNKFMKLSPYGKYAYGMWRCNCGETEYEGLRNAAIVCKTCGTHTTHYDEISILDEEHRLIGHPDFLLYIDGEFHVIEIKSIDRQAIDFDRDLNAPLGDHTLQATFYYWVMKRMGYNVNPNIRILYADRNLRKMFTGIVYKEFVRRVSPEDRLAPFFAKAQEVRNAFATKELPDRICKEEKCGRVQNCAQAVQCFSMESIYYENNRD